MFERTVLDLTAVINHYSVVTENKIISSSFIHTALQLLLRTVPNEDKLGNYEGRQRARGASSNEFKQHTERQKKQRM